MTALFSVVANPLATVYMFMYHNFVRQKYDFFCCVLSDRSMIFCCLFIEQWCNFSFFFYIYHKNYYSASSVRVHYVNHTYLQISLSTGLLSCLEFVNITSLAKYYLVAWDPHAKMSSHRCTCSSVAWCLILWFYNYVLNIMINRNLYSLSRLRCFHQYFLMFSGFKFCSTQCVESYNKL